MAAWDDDAQRFVEIALDLSKNLGDDTLGITRAYSDLRNFMSSRMQDQADPGILQTIKGQHQSQKDTSVFPGDDACEFWMPAEARTRETAKTYDDLGMADYEAIQAFKRWLF